MDFKEIVNFLGVAGTFAAPFTSVGGGLILASKALEKFSEFDSNSVKNDFSGLSALGNELKAIVESGNYDAEKIGVIADSLITLSTAFKNISKMIS